MWESDSTNDSMGEGMIVSSGGVPLVGIGVMLQLKMA